MESSVAEPPHGKSMILISERMVPSAIDMAQKASCLTVSLPFLLAVSSGCGFCPAAYRLAKTMAPASRTARSTINSALPRVVGT